MLFESTIDQSTILQRVRGDIETLTSAVDKLARSIIRLAQTLEIHERAILDLFANQEQIAEMLNKNTTRTSIDVATKPKKDDKASKKPN